MIDAGIGANSASGGYDIDNSVKLEDANNEWLYRASPTAGNRRTYTFSFWIKRTELGLVNGSGNQFVIGQGQHGRMYFGSEYFQYRFDDGHDCRNVSRQFRDTSAWYHFVVAVDTNESSSSNRVKLYVNGESLAVDDHDGGSFPDIQDQGAYFSTSYVTIGTAPFGGSYNAGDGSYDMSGYLADFAAVDGTQYAPTDFGEFDSDSGIWKPKDLSDITWGSEGYYLKFDDSSALGADSSGNGNNFTLNNIAAADQATDTPTNNFVTWLSDGTLFNVGSDNMLFNEGGTRMKRGGGTGWTTHYANMAPSSGKWYFEHESAGANNTMMGAIPVEGTTNNSSGRNNHYLGVTAGKGVGFQFVDRNVYQNGSYYVNGGSNPNSGNIVQVALDLDNGKIYYGLDNVWMNQTGSNPSTGSNGLSLAGWSSEQMWMFAGSSYNPNVNQSTNFGGYSEMSISSAASDSNGYGTFEYAPPTGFYALCTKNLAEYG